MTTFTFVSTHIFLKIVLEVCFYIENVKKALNLINKIDLNTLALKFFYFCVLVWNLCDGTRKKCDKTWVL